MKMTMEELNGICMEMISNAGEGRSKVFEALDSVNKGDYKTAAHGWTKRRPFWPKPTRSSSNS